MKCTYCGKEAQLVTGAEVWPHRSDLHEKKVWVCVPCDARANCHGTSDKPMSSLANAKLRAVRREAHRVFDQAWQSGRISRNAAYLSLAHAMRMSKNRCHIGFFSIKQCRRVIHIVKGWGFK